MGEFFSTSSTNSFTSWAIVTLATSSAGCGRKSVYSRIESGHFELCATVENNVREGIDVRARWQVLI